MTGIPPPKSGGGKNGGGGGGRGGSSGGGRGGRNGASAQGGGNGAVSSNGENAGTLRNSKSFRSESASSEQPAVVQPGTAGPAGSAGSQLPSDPLDIRNFTYDNYIALTTELATVRALLVPVQNAETFEDIKPSVLLDPVLDGLDKAEGYLNMLSRSHFGLMDKCVELDKGLKSCESRLDNIDKGAKNDKVNQRVAKLENTVAVNIATKNLAPTSGFEKSEIYTGLCNDTADSNRIVKLPGLDLGENLSGAKMAAKIRKVLVDKTPGLALSEIQNIVSLKKSTTPQENGSHTVPVLLYTKDKDARFEVENKIKAGDIKETSYHWPAGLVKNVKEIRKQVLKLDHKDFGKFENRQIRIRPSKTGKSLVISYRDTFDDDWEFLESVKTPAPVKMLTDAKAKQPCKSDYFKL